MFKEDIWMKLELKPKPRSNPGWYLPGGTGGPLNSM